MSNEGGESKKKLVLSSKASNEAVGWGPWASIGIGVVSYIVPLVLLGIFIGLLASVRNVDAQTIIDGVTPFQDFGLNLFLAIATVSIVIGYAGSRGGDKALGLTKFKKKYIPQSLAGFGIYLVSFLSIFFLISLVFGEFDADQVQQTSFDDVAGFSELLFAFATLVIITPIYEELLFRGFMFQGIAKAYGFLPAAIVVNGMFGLAHGQLNVAIDTFVLGVVASYLVWKTKSLWPAIILHGAKNLLAFVLRFVIT